MNTVSWSITVQENKYYFVVFFSGEKNYISGHPGFHYLLEKLKRDVFGIPKNPLTHAPLSEKNWLVISKICEKG